MRVAHVGNYKPESLNGVYKTIVGLARHLPDEGFETEVWHFTPKVNRITERRVEGVSIFDLPRSGRRWRDTLSLPKQTARFLAKRAAMVDLAHLHSVFLPENLWVSRLGIDYVVTPHGGYASRVVNGRNRFLKRLWISAFERSYLEVARAVHAVSLPEVDELRRFGITAPIEFVPNGVDEDYLEKDLPKPQEASDFVYLGRLSVEHKGLDLLLEGYAMLREHRSGVVPPLVLAGPDFRGGQKRLQELARRLGIADAVRFPGPVLGEDKWALLTRARLFMHTSRWEGMPFSLLEALSLGRPVLVTPETNLSRYVQEYGAGWVVEGTPKAISQGLSAVIDASPSTLNAAGDRARSLARDNFSWSSVAREMAGVYLNALGWKAAG